MAWMAPTCALCPKPLRRGSLFCSRQCAGKVRQRLAKWWNTDSCYRLNRKYAREWAKAKPGFDAWMREFNP